MSGSSTYHARTCLATIRCRRQKIKKHVPTLSRYDGQTFNTTSVNLKASLCDQFTLAALNVIVTLLILLSGGLVLLLVSLRGCASLYATYFEFFKYPIFWQLQLPQNPGRGGGGGGGVIPVSAGAPYSEPVERPGHLLGSAVLRTLHVPGRLGTGTVGA